MEKTSDYYFDLPKELIATKPLAQRDRCRLLVYDCNTSKITHSHFYRLEEFLEPNTLLAMNNSRVRQARVKASLSGSVSEKSHDILFLEPLDQERSLWSVLVPGAKKLVGKVLALPGNRTGRVVSSKDGQAQFQADGGLGEQYFVDNGHVPLPPYMEREDEDIDKELYQTVYAATSGSAAAPTAGLHFTTELMDDLALKGHGFEYLTLHVGLGTFQPIRSETIAGHTMHRESTYISPQSAQRINNHLSTGGNFVAVGTTSVRTLESHWDSGQGGLVPGELETELYIRPGYQWKLVKNMITNFHTPESSLLVMLSALVGRDELFRIYKEAIDERYRFFSYGDAMLILGGAG